MKIKISEISHKGELYFEPADELQLFKHCSNGATAVEFSKILPIVRLIEVHGEEVYLPHIQLPKAKVFVRKCDGARFLLTSEDEYQMETEHGLSGGKTNLNRFSALYFDAE